MRQPTPSNRSIAILSIVVFALAVALRLPWCLESFWVDELHSAWCVWDGLEAVALRAKMGHQSPFYFLGLWFWKQFIGDSELALRTSSVFAGAASCWVLTVGIIRWSNSLAAGVTAGLILAVESNSIFFGTELRPFAFVMLLASVAIVCFAELASLHSRFQSPRSWLGMNIAILFAAVCQPTSLGVLILLPVVLWFNWLSADRRQLFRASLSDCLLLISGVAVALALWSLTLDESWRQRTNWSSFASATSIWQVWQVWDWTWLWCLPVGLLLAAIGICRSDELTRLARPTFLLALIAVLGTLGYWLVAWIEWLPLWHRRYLIAVLPVLAFLSGGCVAVISRTDRIAKLAPLIAVCLLCGLIYRQDLHRLLQRYPVVAAMRGEDWRGAIDWVRDESGPSDQIYLDSGLIESQRIFAAVYRGIDGATLAPRPSEKQLRYLCYPVEGPYRLERPVEAIGADLEIPIEILNDNTKQIFVIARRPANQISIDSTKWGWVYGNRKPSQIKAFGNVTVILLPKSR